MRIDFCIINFMQGHLHWYGRACISISIYGQKNIFKLLLHLKENIRMWLCSWCFFFCALTHANICFSAATALHVCTRLFHSVTIH